MKRATEETRTEWVCPHCETFQPEFGAINVMEGPPYEYECRHCFGIFLAPLDKPTEVWYHTPMTCTNCSCDNCKPAPPPLRYGDPCRAVMGSPARYLFEGLCAYVSAMDNSLGIAKVNTEIGRSETVLPMADDNELAAIAEGIRWGRRNP